MVADQRERIWRFKFLKDELDREKQGITDDLKRIKNAAPEDVKELRRNEVGRWAANDIIRKGGQNWSYQQLPSTLQNNQFKNPNFVKIPPELQLELNED